jgi:hypothetical protein
MPHITLGPHGSMLYYRRQLFQSVAWRALELADGAVLIFRRRDARTVTIPTGSSLAGWAEAFAGAQILDRRRDGDHTARDKLCEVAFQAWSPAHA